MLRLLEEKTLVRYQLLHLLEGNSFADMRHFVQLKLRLGYELKTKSNLLELYSIL